MNYSISRTNPSASMSGIPINQEQLSAAIVMANRVAQVYLNLVTSFVLDDVIITPVTSASNAQPSVPESYNGYNASVILFTGNASLITSTLTVETISGLKSPTRNNDDFIGITQDVANQPVNIPSLTFSEQLVTGDTAVFSNPMNLNGFFTTIYC